MQPPPRHDTNKPARTAMPASWHPRVPARDPKLPGLPALLQKRTVGRWALLLVAFLLRPDMAVATGAGPQDAQGGSLLFRMGETYAPATQLDTDVSITVNGLVAHVSVMQEFQNSGSDWVEGVYVFPLPDAAAVNRMRLYIGDRFIEGEVREKEQARQDYEQAKREGRKTSLVEQQRANLFTTSVANVAPGETVIVEIEYLEELHLDGGVFSLRFPMTLTPRYLPFESADGSGAPPAISDQGWPITPPMAPDPAGQQASLRATINAGLPLDIVASRYHPVNVSEAGGSYAVTLAGSRVPMDRDFELLWRPVPARTPRAMVFEEPVAGDTHYLLMVVPPDEANTMRDPAAREMLFVIDTSGSMHGVSIAQAKQALLQALNGLRPVDSFNVIEFNSEATSLFPASVPAGADYLARARRFVSGLNADGGTEMRGALELALGLPPAAASLRQIVFITDGAVGDEEELFGMIESGLHGARLFTVGIGSAPNSWFMRKASEAGRGTFTFIGDLNEVGEKMDRLFARLSSPQVTNIEVLWPGGSAVDMYPATVPDLYRGEPVAVRAKLSGSPRPGDRVLITGSAPGGTWSAELGLGGRAPAPGVGALWARARIAELLDAGRRGADPGTTRAAIVETALAHHLVSKHTSLVAVDKTPARPAGDPLAAERLANRFAHGQVATAITGFPATATNAAALGRAGLLAIAAALLLLLTPQLPGGLRRGRAV